MSLCDDYGMNNGCDEHCPALLEGDCSIAEELIEDLAKFIDTELLEDLLDTYGILDIEVPPKYHSIW